MLLVADPEIFAVLPDEYHSESYRNSVTMSRQYGDYSRQKKVIPKSQIWTYTWQQGSIGMITL